MNECPIGSYSNNGICVGCPNNGFTFTSGATSSEDCIDFGRFISSL
jgi:hypothetical protein